MYVSVSCLYVRAPPFFPSCLTPRATCDGQCSLLGFCLAEQPALHPSASLPTKALLTSQAKIARQKGW